MQLSSPHRNKGLRHNFIALENGTPLLLKQREPNQTQTKADAEDKVATYFHIFTHLLQAGGSALSLRSRRWERQHRKGSRYSKLFNDTTCLSHNAPQNENPPTPLPNAAVCRLTLHDAGGGHRVSARHPASRDWSYAAVVLPKAWDARAASGAWVNASDRDGA